jgi:hypothetical protein
MTQPQTFKEIRQRMTRSMLTFATIALAVASAAAPKPLHMTLSEQAWVGSNELQPGDYKVEMQGDKVILILGKKQIELAAKMESNTKKFDTTLVVIDGAGTSRPALQEIDFGGTTTKIVFSTPTKAD